MFGKEQDSRGPALVTASDVVDWTSWAVKYAPKSQPGHGPWRLGVCRGQRLAVCPNCQRRLFERGLRLHDAAKPWDEALAVDDDGRMCIGGCGAYFHAQNVASRI